MRWGFLAVYAARNDTRVIPSEARDPLRTCVKIIDVLRDQKIDRKKIDFPYMGHATKQEFIGRFRAFATVDATSSPVPPKGRNTVMPVGAVYDYLKTVKPLGNKVNSFLASTM